MKAELARRTADVLALSGRPWSAANWMIEAAEDLSEPKVSRSADFCMASLYFLEAGQFALAGQAMARSAALSNLMSEWTTAAFYYEKAGHPFASSVDHCKRFGVPKRNAASA